MTQPPTEVNDRIAGYLSRKDAQSFVDTDRYRSTNLSCSTNCPPNHKCYPAGDDCLLGERRPGRENCCQFDQTAVHLLFVQVVAAMQRVALLNLAPTSNNRGPASEGFIHDLGRLIPANTQPPVGPTFIEARNRNRAFVVLNFMFANDTGGWSIPNPFLAELIRLGSKLFRGIVVYLRDNTDLIDIIDRSVRDKSRVFIETMYTTVPVDIPVDILGAARNIKVVRGDFHGVVPTLTEQRLFEILRHKLQHADDLESKAVMDVLYINDGQNQVRFNTVIEACNGTRFRGYILCRLLGLTNVIQGTFHGVTISVISSTTLGGGADEPHGFKNFNGGSLQVLRISR